MRLGYIFIKVILRILYRKSIQQQHITISVLNINYNIYSINKYTLK